MQAEFADRDYLEYLRALDAAPFEVTDWESRFIESILTRGLHTEKQRRMIDALREKYSGRL